MVPLVGSSLRNPRYIARDQQSSIAHNDWHDDSVSFEDCPGVSLFSGTDLEEILAASETCWNSLQGPIPPSVFGRASKKDDDADAASSEHVKAKRKCGRPRNPIPRHKRESHINAEHRRRGKIQNGFRTLKGMVPKYEHSSGRDSKADILFKAVDHCKQLTRETDDIIEAMTSLRAEKESLNNEIRNYQSSAPSLNEMTKSMNDRFDDYAEEKTNNGWAAWTLKLIIRPLFDSYVSSVCSSSLTEFLTSVTQWADNALDANSIRHTVVASLQAVAIETDLGSSVDMEEERFSMVPEISHMPLQINDKTSQNLSFHTSACHSPTSPLINSYSPQNMTPYSPQNMTPYSPQNMTPYSPHNASSTLSPHSPIMQAYRTRGQCYDPAQQPGQVGEVGIPLSGHPMGTPSEVVSFEDDSRGLPNLSPRMGYQHNADLLPFTDSHNINSSSLFSDLPLGMDANISLGGYLRTNNDSFEDWHQQEQQQQYQNYSGLLEVSQPHSEHFENDENMPETNTFFDMNKTHSNWSSTQFLDHSQPLHFSEYSTFSERDGKYDSPVSQESSPTLTQLDSSPAYSQRIRRTAEDQKHKSPSLSSTEGDVGVLCMTSFSKQAMEVSQDQDRYCPLTPSTDGCNSPIDVSHFDSPFAQNDRVSHELSFHEGSRNLRSLNKSIFLDPIYKTTLTNGHHIPSSLPSYKDTFGLRVDHQKLKGTTGRHVSDSSPSEMDTAPFNKLKNMESSSLLAELLGPTKFFKSTTFLTTNSRKEVGQNRRQSSSSGSSPSQQWSSSDCLSEVNGRTLHRQPQSDNQSKHRALSAGSFLISDRNSQSNITTPGSDNSNSRSDNVRPSINTNDMESLEKIEKFKVSDHLSFEVAHQMLLQSYGIVSDSCGKSHGDFDDVFARSKTSFLDQSPSVSEVDTMITMGHVSRPSEFVSSVGPLTLGTSRASSERSTASRKISFEDCHHYDKPNDGKKYCQWPSLDQSFDGVRLDGLQPRYCSAESSNLRNEGLEMKPLVNQV